MLEHIIIFKKVKKILLFICLCTFSSISSELNSENDVNETVVSIDTTLDTILQEALDTIEHKYDSTDPSIDKNTIKSATVTKAKEKKIIPPPLSIDLIKECVSHQSLRAVAFLWTEKDASGIIRPGDGIVDKPPSGAAYQLFSELTARPSNKSFNYKVGDTIDILKSLRFVHFNNKTANLIKRTGRAVIKEIKQKKLRALLFEVWDVISGDEMISPSVPIYSYSVDTLFKPEIPISAKIFTKIEETICPYPLQMIILDKGKNNGIGLGDVFGIYHQNKEGISSMVAIGSVVNVDEISATVRIILIHNSTIAEGDEALLIRRPRLTILE